MDAREVAGKLTKAQREELLHYKEGDGFMPPHRAATARYMWNGIIPRGMDDPVFLLKRAHGACLYMPTPLGFQVAALLTEKDTHDGR